MEPGLSRIFRGIIALLNNLKPDVGSWAAFDNSRFFQCNRGVFEVIEQASSLTN